MPIVIAFVMSILNPDYLQVLFTDPIGRGLLGGAFVGMILAVIQMKKIVTIRV